MAARRLVGEAQPVDTHAVAYLDIRHVFDELLELGFAEVLADPPDAGRNLPSRDFQRDPTFYRYSRHSGKYFRIVCALGHTHPEMRLAILTISTAGARGERKDTSGDAIAA